MRFPFEQTIHDDLIIREFKETTNPGELVWHRDRRDRYVKIVSGIEWKIQYENKLPVNLIPGKTYFIPKNTYHRVLKGEKNLVVEIKEL